MKLSEVAVGRDLFWRPASSLFDSAWIAVPRGTLWQKDLHNVWRFTSQAAIRSAINTPVGEALRDSTSGYLVPMETYNGLHLLLQVFADGDGTGLLHDKRFKVLAFGPTETSVRKAAIVGMRKLLSDDPTLNMSEDQIWCYKTWNSDPSIFYIPQEDLEYPQ